jgi:hypothetical protein
LSDEVVLGERSVEKKKLLEFGFVIGEDLVEDVVASLTRSLTNHTRLFEQI